MDQKNTLTGVTQFDEPDPVEESPPQREASSESGCSIVQVNESETSTVPARLTTMPDEEVTDSQWKKTLEALLDHNYTTIFMTIITIYALFGDDIRVLAFAKSDDDVFYGISVGALFFFMLELVVSTMVKKAYFNSFYFWLDLIATVSLIPDIGWIWFPIIQQDEDSSGNDAEQIQNAGKASRAGTRTSRIIRIIRLIRLIRIVKLYKNAQKALAEKEEG